MRRRTVLLILMVAGCVALFALRVPLLTAAGSFLVTQDPLQPGDAILVLSGSTPDRILEAVDLYGEGFAPRLVLTRGHPPPGIDVLRARGVHMKEPHEVNQWIAVRLGIPPESITTVGRSAGSTATEAESVIRYVRENGWRRVLIVTSKLHTRRAGWIYRTLAQGSLEVVMCPSRYDAFSAESWWRSRTFTRRVVIEYEKLLVFLVRDWWRPRGERNPVGNGVRAGPKKGNGQAHADSSVP